MQQTLADETLVAYVDGELSHAEARAVEAKLAMDAEAAHKVVLMRRSAEALRGAFDEIMSEPIPDRFLDILDAMPRQAARPETWLMRSLAAMTAPRQLMLAGALGAVTLLVGIGLGHWSAPQDAGYVLAGIDPDAGASFDRAVTTIMNTGVEGASAAYERADIGVQGTVTALAIVPVDGDVLCRAFRDDAVNGTMVLTARGIACRGADGAWVSLLVPEGIAP